MTTQGEKNAETVRAGTISTGQESASAESPLHRLAVLQTQYEVLSGQQEKLEEWTSRLQREEAALLEAIDLLQQDKPTTSRPSAPEHQQAIRRLEEALWNDDDDSSSSGNNDEV